VQNDYMTPAIKAATGLALESELGHALCFDILCRTAASSARL